jgi:hypothetical protein
LDLGQNNMITQVRKLHSKLIYTQVPENVFHAVASLITTCTKEALKVLKTCFLWKPEQRVLAEHSSCCTQVLDLKVARRQWGLGQQTL